MVKDWIEKPLGELFNISGGLSASRAQLSTIGHAYLHYGDIHGSMQTFIDVCADGFIPRLDVPLSKVSKASLLQDGDVVFVDASEDDDGASRHIVVRNNGNKPFISGLHTIVAKAKTDELDNRYREHCFQTEAVKAQFKFYAVGTKVVGVSKTSIKNINLYFPVDKSEQRRIATALSDADAYIAALEKLIAKKRAIKQGAMQELLAGKRRLPGFDGKWKTTEIGNEFDLFAGGDLNKDCFSPNQSNSHKYPVYANALQNYGLYGYTSEPRYMGDSITITGRGDVGIAMYRKGNFDAIVRLLVLTPKPKNKADSKFTTSFINCCIDFPQESTGVPQLTVPQIRSIELLLPTKSEQIAIAAVLSDMDTEIDTLTDKLKKVRKIKQGMMSELLTGNIRLIEEDNDNGEN